MEACSGRVEGGTCVLTDGRGRPSAEALPKIFGEWSGQLPIGLFLTSDR